MSKIRKGFREFKPNKQKQFFQSKRRDEDERRQENKMLSLLHTAAEPLSFTQVQDSFPVNSRRQTDLKTDLKATLGSLLHAGLVGKDKKGRYKIHKNAPLFEGVLVQHPKGFGFVNVTKCPNNDPCLKRDPFIGFSQMSGAQHGDRVLIRVFRIRSDDRPEGGVIKILSPGSNRIGGIFIHNGSNRLVYPDDRRFPFIIRIDDSDDLQPKDGDGVIVEYARSTGPAKFLPGKIIEILGRSDAVDTQMRLVIEQFNLPYRFSDEVIKETATLDETFSPEPNREDLRTTAHVTIDGEDAKDFDDAICVSKTRKGFRLIVSIADVSHFVKPGSAIDREAYRRGTSIYFPGRVIPMLPEKLSNNLCSLVPEEDRFTVSAILDFDREGTVLTKRFARSIIRSQHRFTYTTVRKILLDQDPEIRGQHKPFLTELKWAMELATALQKKRRQRGAVDFNLSEPVFTLTDSGEIESIKRLERNIAHQIIEEFMLAANEAVAELFSGRKMPAIFRVHEPPDLLKAEEFADFVRSLGLSLPRFVNYPAWFAEVLEQCKGTKYEYIINNLLLRSMKQAQYSAENVGHFGLAASDYTHFTSPIRRYPDLIVHRELLRLLPLGSQQNRADSPHPSLKESSEFLSARERTAVMAERDINDRLKTSYMKKHVGDSFDAVVSGVTDNAMYVELPELCIGGSIPVELLDDDYYIFDKKNHRLFGELTARTYQIGDSVRVTLVDADILSKKITFTLASNALG